MDTPLSPGSSISRYRVVSRIGAGGMGEVYKAEDESLGRAVAIKILPSDLMKNEDRVRRFVQEAKAASSLNHPHILHIYEIGKTEPREGSNDEGLHFIAMEYVDGPTLRDVIYTQKPGLKKTLELLAQVADALAKAHSAGIVHRDLKPENVVVTSDGYAKIIDFGLAKLLEPAAAKESDSLQTAVKKDETGEGVVLGTVGYMAPEQVQGKNIDHRADIFSFGCLVYEAVTRHRAFEADSKIDTMHKIVHAQPTAMMDLNPGTPFELQRIVRRCLAKDPDERYQSIKDVAIELRELREDISGISSGPRTALVGTPRRPRYLVPLVVGILLLSIVAAVAITLRRRSSSNDIAAKPNEYHSITIKRITHEGNTPIGAISPDGKYLAEVVVERGQFGLYVTHLATNSRVQVVPSSDRRWAELAFSPDGNYIDYVTYERSGFGTLYEIPVLGGTPRKLVFDIDSTVSFSPDGKSFAFIRGFPHAGAVALLVANRDGSGVRELVRIDQRKIFNQNSPAWSPDGKTILAIGSLVNASETPAALWAVDVATAKMSPVATGRWRRISGVAWTPDAKSIVVAATEPSARLMNQLWLVPFPSGEPRRLTNDFSNYSTLSMTSDGKTLCATQASPSSSLWISEGSKEPAQITTGGERFDGMDGAAILPNGTIVYATNSSNSIDLFSLNPATGEQKQLTNEKGFDGRPDALGDGIVFQSDRGGAGALWRIDADGSNPRVIVNRAGNPSATPDGKWIVYDSTVSYPSTLWKIPVDGGTPVQLTKQFSRWPSVSPDGKWIACHYWDTADIGASWKVAIVPIEGGEPVRKFDIDAPFRNGRGTIVEEFGWTADSRNVLSIASQNAADNIEAQPIDGGKTFPLTHFTSQSIFAYAVSRDGKTIVMSRGTITSNVVAISDFQ